MRGWLICATMLAPAAALAAPPPPVPGIQATAAAYAAASASPAAASAAAQVGGQRVIVPAGMPPPVTRLSPSAKLNAKERASSVMARRWRDHYERPARGADGVLRWTFGESLPSVVCSPLEVCDVALQPGEVVNSIHIGDKVRWSIMPAVSGLGADRTTHLIIKPSDAGLVTSILVFTDKRTYSIKLISTQHEWTPLTAFSYPDDENAAWAHYGATVTAGASQAAPTSAGTAADLHFYTVTGSAPWRPVRVYSSAGKTYIQFPRSMAYGTAPALIGLANDGSWFNSASEQMVVYRIEGDKYVVDGVLDHAELVTGVGSSQTKVVIRRGG